MGTYHYLDGARVRVFYRGNIKTCGRCHKSAHECPGGALAKICEEKGGVRLSLADHMRKTWSEIGFQPQSFKLPDSVDEVHDIPISDLLHFENSAKATDQSASNAGKDRVELGHTQPVSENCTGVKINNFPLEMSNDEIIGFLQNKISPQVVATDVDIVRNKKNSNATIHKGLSLQLINKVMEEIDFSNSKKLVLRLPLYCRPIRNLTPEKSNDGVGFSSYETPDKDLKNGRRVPLPRIPGLPPKAQRQALEKAKSKSKQSAEKGNKSTEIVPPKSAFDVLMNKSREHMKSPVQSPIHSMTAKRGSSELASPSSPCDNDPKRNKNGTPQ